MTSRTTPTPDDTVTGRTAARRARPAALALAAGALLSLIFTGPAAASAASAPAPIPLTSSQCPTDIQQGEVDGCVTELQDLLNSKGGAGLTVDGDFGPATFNAVESWQGNHGLGVDGIVGPDTKASLDGSGSGGGSHTNVEWADLVLSDGGWPTGGNNQTVVLQWMASEEPVSNWYNGLNPLNDTQNGGSYANLRVAASTVASTLKNGNYPSVIADLASSAAVSTTAHAIQFSPWACGHYSGSSTCNTNQSQWGAAWHSSAVSTVAAPSSDW